MWESVRSEEEGRAWAREGEEEASVRPRRKTSVSFEGGDVRELEDKGTGMSSKRKEDERELEEKRGDERELEERRRRA